MSLRIGDIFSDSSGTFEVTQSLGAGGFGEAFVVLDMGTGSELIAKAPVPIDEIRIKSVRNEFKVLSELKRKSVPGVVRPVSLAEFSSPNGTNFPVLLMEKARGVTLDEVIKNGPMHYEDVADVMSKLADSLTQVHQSGYMHLDIAPDNVFIDDPGGLNEITIIDFGIAAQKSDTNTFAVSQAGHNKPFFGAPEIGERAASCGSDIFSVGATGFALIFGKPEFDRVRQGINIKGPYDAKQYLPPGTKIASHQHLHDVIKKATWSERSGRFATMEDLGNAVAGKEPDENFPRLVADGRAHRMAGDGPWVVGRKSILEENQPDIIVQETSPTNRFISRKHARVERRPDGVLMIHHTGVNDTRVQVKVKSSVRWIKVGDAGYPLGSRHQIICFGYADHAPKALDMHGNPLEPGPYKIVEFFPPSQESGN